jgi:DNA-3-methyladenine glycosylase II
VTRERDENRRAEKRASLPRTLSEADLLRGVRLLSGRDPDLAAIVKTIGPPPMWAREPGFATLLYIILEQQVSLASARAAFDRLRSHISPLTPSRFLELDDATLKGIGFSRQKTGYGRHLAEAVLTGRLNLGSLHRMSDDAVKRELLAVKGIGHWTADIYLLMALRRPDIWPVGDLALAVAAQRVKRLKGRPSADELEKMSRNWRPWRAVAARLLWHDYLSTRPPRRG